METSDNRKTLEIRKYPNRRFYDATRSRHVTLEDIRDLRSLLTGFRLAKRTAVQTAVRIITTGILLALMAGIAIKLKLFGPTP